MGIEKMSLLSVEGSIDDLESALMACCDSHQFQITTSGAVLRNLNEQNPYLGIYSKIHDMAVNLKIEPEYCDFKSLPFDTPEEFDAYFNDISRRYYEINDKLEQVNRTLEDHKTTDAYLQHLVGLDVSFHDLFSLKYVKMRIGRLPAENEQKLGYYVSKCFIFLPFERAADYVYGIYLAPKTLIEIADDVMTSLAFERTRLPDYLEENAEGADKKLAEAIERESRQKEELEKELAYLIDSLKSDFNAVLCKLKYKSDCFELRKKAVISAEKFSFSGFCPTKECGKLIDSLKKVSPYVQCVEIPVDKKGASDKIPVKLKNNWFIRPFEMFVKMYGLPSYNTFDPTPYVAVTYMILFGLMFGDVGQGFVLLLLGLLLTKLTKNGLAPIISRLGIFSMLGGCIYGSVFGLETIIKPIFHRENIWNGVCKLFSNLGVAEHPDNIFGVATVVLLFALAIGIILILISMIFNMILKFKAGKTGEAIFEVNGVCGIVLYASLVIGLVCQLLYGIPVMTAPYILCLVALPAVLIFFKEPIINKINHKKSEEPFKVGSFIISNIIELFEAAISFLSNTMSYLRIGGFVLSHAGFMLVVSMMSKVGTGVPVSAGNIVGYVIGNLLVMGIEGFLVGIQVLRLEFYEIFNRFYEAGGTDFKPVEIKLDAE